MKRLILSLIIAVGSVASYQSSHAQEKAPAPPDDLRAVLEMMRSDVNGFKIATLNRTMGLTGPEAEAFWPIYRAYEKELSAVGDRKVALIREYAALRASNALDQKTWDELAKRSLKNVQDRLDLWKKYQKKISKALSPMRAAQFLQVEHQMALFIDLSIAAEMPVVGSSPSK